MQNENYVASVANLDPYFLYLSYRNTDDSTWVLIDYWHMYRTMYIYYIQWNQCGSQTVSGARQEDPHSPLAPLSGRNQRENMNYKR